jgi:protease-4
VRAVVVRLETGGGSVTASDAIARELDLVRKEKPVVISMGNACASGGYYIATAGQYMFADAATITGSIGIFYPKVDLSGLLDKLGIGQWQVDFGKRAGLRSWWKPYDADDRDAAYADIRRGYEVFTKRVGKARSMDTEQIDRVARGRVWSGVRALEVGLVDDYGGLREAVLRARAIAGMRADEGDVVLLPEPPGLLENLRNLFNVKIPLPLGGSTTRGGSMDMAILAPIVRVLRHLPVNLWLADGPEPLALMEESIAIED